MKADKFGRLKLEGDARANLASRLTLMIEDARNATSQGLIDRWRRNYSFYRGVPELSTSMLPGGAVPMHFHLTKPRIDALCDAVAGNIGSQTPMLLAKFDRNDQAAKKLETEMQRAMDRANIDARIKQWLPMAAICGVAPVRARFECVAAGYLPGQIGGVQSSSGTFDYCGLVFDTIDPTDFVIYQPQLYTIDTSPLVGHRCPCTRAEIAEKIKQGDYDDFDDEKVDGFIQYENIANAQVRGAQVTKPTQSTAVANEDQIVERYEVIFKADLDTAELEGGESELRDGKNERYYIASVLPADRAILAIREYDLKKPWYVDLRVQCPEPGNWWPDGSVANDLQGLQDIYNHLHNIFAFGAYFSAFPAVADPAYTEDKVKPLSPGAVVGGEAKAIQTGFNGAPITLMIQQVERMADAIIGISQAGIAQQFSRDVTATEASQIFAGQSKREAGYTGQFSEGLERLGETCQELLFLNGELYAMAEQVDPQIFTLPCVWEVNGRSPGQTPEATLKKLELLLQLTQSDGPQPEAIVQGITAKIAEFISGTMEGQVDPETGQPVDPKAVEGQAMQMATQLVQEAMQGVPPTVLDKPEIYRSIVDSLELPNGDRIKRENPEEQQPESPEQGLPPEMAGAM